MIFADSAPKFWARGLPAIPLKAHDKMPAISGWQFFSQRMPNEGEMAYWLKTHADGNVGLVLGAQSGLCMIDIDTDDERIKQIILDVLSPFKSPWHKIGSKGMTFAYRQPVQGGPLKTFRIGLETKGSASTAMVVECLSMNTQTCMPPSIHPSTGRPYQENVSLFDVLDDLPNIPSQIELLLRGSLQDEGIKLSHKGWTRITDFTSVGSRDSKMTAISGLMAQGVTRGEMTLVQAIDRMTAWKESCVEAVAGNDIDIEKGQKKVVEFLSRDVIDRKKPLPKGWDLGLSPEDKTRLGVDFKVEHEEWEVQQLMDYLQKAFETHAPNSAPWTDAINYVLEKMSRSQSLDILQQEIVTRYIASASGGVITKSRVEQRLKEIKNGKVKGQDHTEIAQAVITDINEYGEVRWHIGRFWQWGGSHWELRDDDDMMKTIAENYGALAAAKKRSDHLGILKTMQTLCKKDVQELRVTGVNFANGFLTQDLRLLPHNSQYGCTYTLPFRYMPELSSAGKQWGQFLERIWTGMGGPDVDIEEKKMALQEAMAVTLFGMGPRFARVILLKGLARTGKSQVLKVIEELVPLEAKSAIPPNDWGDRFLPAQMAGKLLNLAGELSENKSIDGQKFKQIVSGETITGQYKNAQPFEFSCKATHWFASNHLPLSSDFTDGFNRRWLVLMFEHPISIDEQVTDFGNILVADEREAIVAWAVEAMARLNAKQDYTLPISHVSEMKDVANQNDSVRHFITQSGMVRIVHPAPGSGPNSSPHISEAKLYDAYSSFCALQGGARRVSLTKFGERMKEFVHGMGIRRGMKPTAFGTEEGVYHNITLAELKGG